ncbi:hypothetical protein TNIN_442611 [Trichonephila inaurata madagascariensis]|uniref:Uncharacterized protein n=1 Tax=Trichonephila inaurata madagascariensis TaxID=2747483 RepID=A0A8X6X9C6_9ARAC|nr:hypothetical protein TNIN_442611 [Trichonephila inaurata madagascariensis]
MFVIYSRTTSCWMIEAKLLQSFSNELFGRQKNKTEERYLFWKPREWIVLLDTFYLSATQKHCLAFLNHPLIDIVVLEEMHRLKAMLIGAILSLKVV